MKPRAFDPLHLDVAAFAAQSGALDGSWPASELPRLAEAARAESVVEPNDAVNWHAEGELRERPGTQPDVWLHLQANTAVWLQCQRCLQPLREALGVDRSFRFLRDERLAAEEDSDSEEDVLALTRSLNLRELVEDELILGLPLVPRHEVCPQPLVAPSDAAAEPQPEQRPNPFAQLAVLKRDRGT